MKQVGEITLDLSHIEGYLSLTIIERSSNSLWEDEDAVHYGGAKYQLREGCFYDYELSSHDYYLADPFDNIVQPHKRATYLGRIVPNIYVGTLEIPLFKIGTLDPIENIQLEVQSSKAGYRDDYRYMLEYIAEKCTDLLLQANSPIYQHFEVDYTKDSQALYQKFAFIKSIIGSDEFAEAVHRIVIAPVTKWTEVSEEKDIRNVRRFSNATIKQFLKGGKRTELPEDHHLKRYGVDTLPERISTTRKVDSVDTPENRFIKHALANFLKFCTDINEKANALGHKKMLNESEMMIRELENQLHHTVFQEISRPTTLKLNSPVLQRKEGYREILRVWLMFDLAAKLIWTGGDDVYSGGKKDVATLYEYWLFFQLLDLFQSIFAIEPKHISDLIKETPDGLNLQIRQGKFTALEGVYNSENRKFNIRFNYNRTFSGKQNYPDSGSWTTTLRPDYTLSIWPLGISEEEAERQELIVHVHFDAKYKVANPTAILDPNLEGDLDDEKVANRRGIYKNADLLKMHAYKDAIRRTGGAYVLYPGETSIKRQGFHEIIPGLGAFAVKPSKKDSGIGELRDFILKVIAHFMNRASQREKIAYRTYDIYKNPPASDDKVEESLPEPYGPNRDLIPDDTHVLMAYYKSDAHLKWINKHKLYNFRMDGDKGALTLTKESLSSKYLLLHTLGDKTSGQLWRIVGKGFRVTSKKTLQKLNYPSPGRSNYLVVRIEKVNTPEFKDVYWDFKKLRNYKKGIASAFPFTTTLTELMKNKIK